MKDKRRRMVAPIVVTVLMTLYYLVYFGFLITLLPGVWKWLLGLIPLGFSLVMLAVCKERLDEIRKGEEDDLGQY